MEWISFLFAFFKAIPILDKWADRTLTAYKDWKLKHANDKVDEALDKARDEENTEDLQDRIGRNL